MMFQELANRSTAAVAVIVVGISKLEVLLRVKQSALHSYGKLTAK
jgi:hypothetical protein